jgi:protein tyrosine phosphatase (PTP) superfamily phosphohydrolase (DUF442 family)
MSRLPSTTACLLALALAACRSEKPAAPAVEPAPSVGSIPTTLAPAASAALASPAPPAPEPNSLPPILKVGQIENFRRLSARIAQGGGPETAADFEALNGEGFTTLVSVDGAMPHVELARAAGLDYVHVPIGYDGLSADEQARIIKAVEASEGPVFIHCHHGLHRGPAAAAVARMAVDGISPAEASLELKDSGCSPSYPGLFRDVEQFKAPSAATLAAIGPLPEVVKPAGVRDTMVHVDEHMDYLKASQAAKWKASPQFPDVAPTHEATLMFESFRELQRLPEAQGYGADFLALAKVSEEAAAALKLALDSGPLEKADAAFAGFKQSCESCHKTWRN